MVSLLSALLAGRESSFLARFDPRQRLLILKDAIHKKTCPPSHLKRKSISDRLLGGQNEKHSESKHWGPKSK
jgi:hypothetical protein